MCLNLILHLLLHLKLQLEQLRRRPQDPQLHRQRQHKKQLLHLHLLQVRLFPHLELHPEQLQRPKICSRSSYH